MDDGGQTVVKNLIKRLRGRAGESLAEVLVALLISTLGILLLGTMIQSARKMIVTSRSSYQDYIEAENALEAHSGVGNEGVIRVYMDGKTVKLTDESRYDTRVVSHSNAASGGRTVVSYRVKSDET